MQGWSGEDTQAYLEWTEDYSERLEERINEVDSTIVADRNFERLVERINEAITLAEVHELCGKRDFWCTAPCASEKTGEDLGGTRITLQATQHGGFDFSIRTPGTGSLVHREETLNPPAAKPATAGSPALPSSKYSRLLPFFSWKTLPGSAALRAR